MATKTVKCVLLGNDDVDKRELFFKIVSILKPKREKPEAPENEAELAQDEFLRNNTLHIQEVGVQFEHLSQPTRFQVLHHTEKDEGNSDDENKESDEMETWAGGISVDGKTFNIEIYDSTSQEAFDQLRPELYPDTDVFLICFSVVLLNSLQDVETKWVPEVNKFCPVTPFILVGTHTNWRGLGIDQNNEIESAEKPVYPETGAIYANRVGAVRYMECSTNDPEAVLNIFNEAVRVSCMDRMELSQLLPDYVKFGSTLLHQAAQANHEPSIEALAYVMDIDTKDNQGRRPLDIAIRSNHIESARALILSGSEVKVENEDWQKRCVFWLDGGQAERIIHRNINELARRVLSLYASWDTPSEANVLLIGQHNIEVAKFLRETAPYIPIKSLGIINAEGPCLFDFNMLQLCISCLTITDCDLGEMPHSIYELVNLERLSLVSCNISSLKSEISNLRYLQRLRLTDNKLKALPDSIGRLHNLRFLLCDYNILQSLPDQMGCLGNLEVLELTHNKLEKLSASLGLLSKLKRLKFDKNKELKFPPEDILRKGSDQVLEFLNNFLDEPVPNKQVKVTIVGGEGVGKTTLVKALCLKRNWKFSVMDSAEKTKGVEISDIELNESLRMKVFDLGGDVCYLNIHSLFLSENCLYQAAFDMSTYTVSACSSAFNQLGMLELWLQMIYSQAPNSHVVIIATNAGHSDLTDHLRGQIREDVERMIAKYRQGHKNQFGGEAVPQCALCDGTHLCDVSSSQFYIHRHPGPETDSKNAEPCIPHIVGYYEISCKEPYPKNFLGPKNLGLQKLKLGLSLKMDVLLSSSVGLRIPQKCLYFRDRVLEILETDSELQEQPIITLTRLREVALGCGMRDDHKLKAMISYFHTQGDFLWFEDVPELSEVVFVNPRWLADQLRTLYPPFSGHHCIAHGILRTDNLAKLWPDLTASERELLHSLVRKLGLCFRISDEIDLFPSLFPLGSPGKSSWPPLPLPDEHQLTVEFAFSFLPPTFFGDLIVIMNKRELVSTDLSEPTYYRLHVVFSTYLKAAEGCVLHNRENRPNNPLEQLELDDEASHVIHIEAVPHAGLLRASVRGPVPCCVLPEVRAAIKSVSDVRYPGLRFNEVLICPVCEIIRDATAKTPVHFQDLSDNANKCAKGHECGSKTELLSGCVPKVVTSPDVNLTLDLCNGHEFLEDNLCPKLFIVLPIGFRSPALKGCHVMSHVPEGYAVHFLCECPGYWHLVPDSGYRISRPDEFFTRFGERTCRLIKVIFLMGEDDSLTYPSLKNFLLKIVVGDPAQRETLASDLKNLLEHYYKLFPEVVEGCAHFLDDDLEYLLLGKDLRRSKLARMLELSAEGRTFGPLVCTYVERHKENMWLCRKHAIPIAHASNVQ